MSLASTYLDNLAERKSAACKIDERSLSVGASSARRERSWRVMNESKKERWNSDDDHG